MAEDKRAAQWIKIPTQAVAVADYVTAEDPTTGPINHTGTFNAAAFLSSPKDAEHGYGVGLPITVRTVAFGAVPIQARVQLEQLLDSSGLPVPLQATETTDYYREPQEVRPGFSPTQRSLGFHLTGQVRARVTDLSIDGAHLDLVGRCQTAPIDLDLTSEPYWHEDPLADPTAQTPPMIEGSTEMATWAATHHQADAGTGGAVSGTAAIPAFAGCRTSTGEDISRLLTAAVSGVHNEVTVGLATVGGFHCASRVPPFNYFGTRAPFAGDPSDCDPGFTPPIFHYPPR